MADLVVLAILIIAVAVVVSYIVKEKKRGGKCLGCPYSGSCNKKSSGCNSNIG